MHPIQPPEASSLPPETAQPSMPGQRPKTILFAALALALLAALAITIDIPVARWARDTRLPSDLARLVRLSEAFGFGGTVLMIIVTASLLDGRGCRVMLRLAASSLGAGLVADGVKLVIARQRPGSAGLESGTALDTFSTFLPAIYREALPTAYGHAWQSFPSAHAATAAGLAAGLALLYPKGRFAFAAFALLACCQRVEAQAHFVSDVLAGAALGCLVAVLAGKLACRHG